MKQLYNDEVRNDSLPEQPDSPLIEQMDKICAEIATRGMKLLRECPLPRPEDAEARHYLHRGYRFRAMRALIYHEASSEWICRVSIGYEDPINVYTGEGLFPQEPQ